MRALDGKALLEHGEAIARRYASRVGAEVAEELCAEAVLRALRSPAPDGRSEPWLEGIYKNLVIDHWRRRQLIAVDVNELHVVSTSLTPEDSLLARERRRLVRAGLRRLPRESRQALLSRYYGELDETAAAHRLGVAGVTVRTRVHRALVRLRARLGDLRAFLPPLWGRLTGQIAAVGVAPVLVAALMVRGASAPEAQPLEITGTPTLALRVAPSLVRTEIHPPAPTALLAPMRAHAAKKTTAVLPVAMATAMQPAPAVMTEILWPEHVDIFAEPDKRTLPCMVEAPTTFALQIEKMVEDQL